MKTPSPSVPSERNGERERGSIAPRLRAIPGGSSETPDEPGSDPPESADLNLRILNALAKYVVLHHGSDALGRVAAAAGLLPSHLDGRSVWVSHERFEKVLAAARDLMGTDAVFRNACAWQFAKKGLGYRCMLWAISPWIGYSQGIKTMHLITHISDWSMSREQNCLRMQYSTRRPESRLMCLSRQGQLAAVPTLWGLPPAHLTEEQCVAHGDACCTYVLRVYERLRWAPAALGSALGLAGALIVEPLGVSGVLLWVFLPLVGALCGLYLELARTNRTNLEVGTDIQADFHRIAEGEAEARQELVELHQRQREWMRILEDQVAERSRALHHMADSVRRLQEKRVHMLRSFSHDLRNPMTVVRASASYLASEAPTVADRDEVLQDMQEAILRMNRLLQDLMETATAESTRLQLSPEEVEVPPLVDTLRRRLQALVYGRDIRVTVFSMREAPPFIRTDQLLFDRVLDNLFTNAAKYTTRGSILVELGGTPGFLTVKISDTGCGIAPEAIERIFRAGESHRTDRAPDSFGVGLSVVVQLLAQIGGRLELMSKPNVGTTFWVYMPITLDSKRESVTIAPPGDATSDLVSRVVRIRHMEDP